jgi:hypothetical protein
MYISPFEFETTEDTTHDARRYAVFLATPRVEPNSSDMYRRYLRGNGATVKANIAGKLRLQLVCSSRIRYECKIHLASEGFMHCQVPA